MERAEKSVLGRAVLRCGARSFVLRSQEQKAVLGRCERAVSRSTLRVQVLVLGSRQRKTWMPDQVRHDGKEERPRKTGTDKSLRVCPVFREDRDPEWELVRMTRRDCHPVMLLFGTRSLYSGSRSYRRFSHRCSLSLITHHTPLTTALIIPLWFSINEIVFLRMLARVDQTLGRVNEINPFWAFRQELDYGEIRRQE